MDLSAHSKEEMILTKSVCSPKGRMSFLIKVS